LDILLHAVVDADDARHRVSSARKITPLLQTYSAISGVDIQRFQVLTEASGLERAPAVQNLESLASRPPATRRWGGFC
jgi:hypothetical protein